MFSSSGNGRKRGDSATWARRSHAVSFGGGAWIQSRESRTASTRSRFRVRRQVARDVGYSEWAERLSDFFLNEAHDGAEILFAVDSMSLAEASGLDEGDAAASLAAAVRDVITDRWQVGLVIRRVRQWRDQGQLTPHPALPFLALTVLAASRMGESDAISPIAYYKPLRQLIFPADTAGGAPGSFTDHIEELWQDFAQWVNDDLGGRRGTLVLRDPGFHRFVGPAIQHAIVRSSDLRHLDEFFWRIGLGAQEEVPGVQLRRSLAVWARPKPVRWAKRLLRIADDKQFAQYCEALLEREAARWDGRPHDPRTGRPIGRIRLGISSPRRRPSFGFYAQWDDRLPENVVVMIKGETRTMRRSHGWYAPHPLPEIELGEALRSGVEFRSDGAPFTFPALDAYALSYDDDLGIWVSVDTVSYGDQHLIMVREKDVADAFSYLSAISSSPPTKNRRTASSWPQGWRIIENVRIDARPQGTPPLALASLIPVGGGPRLRLVGGLPITSSVAVYLQGGEPAVALNDLGEAFELLVHSTESEDVWRVDLSKTQSREIPLWNMGLTPGRYLVAYGESTVGLQIVDGIAEAAGPGSGSIIEVARDGIVVSGTRTVPPSDLRPPITVRVPPGERPGYLVGRAPHHVESVVVPRWIAQYVGYPPSWMTLDAWSAFDPVWYLSPAGPERYNAELVSGGAGPPPSVDDAGENSWAPLLGSADLEPACDSETRALWTQYVEVAESYLV